MAPGLRSLPLMRAANLRRRRGLTFLMVSHDLAVVTHLCERLMVMQRGQMVEQVASADLAAHRVSNAYTLSLMQASVGFSRTSDDSAGND